MSDDTGRATPVAGPVARLHPPDPPLTADDVALRPLRADDAGMVAEACCDPDITRFTFMEAGTTEEQAERWIEWGLERWSSGAARFAVIEQPSGAMVGMVGLAVSWRLVSAEAYYWLLPAARGRGIALRAVGLVCDWAFDVVGLERLFLLVHPENGPSNRLAERAGFAREGVLRAYEPFKGGRPDLASWSLLPADPRPWR